MNTIEPETWNNILNFLVFPLLIALGRRGTRVAREVTDNMSNRIVERLGSIEHRLEVHEERFDSLDGKSQEILDATHES